MAVLVDSSFLYSLIDTRDDHHETAKLFLATNKEDFIIPDVTLPEVTHVLNKRIGHHAVAVFLKAFLTLSIVLETITLADIERSLNIMENYPEAKLDFVDCCLMALAERLTITQVCTFDRRDFSIFRPVHCDYLELLP